jgi:large subunit ribosomal protein L7Ae
MTKMKAPKELVDKVLQALEIARNTGKIRKGTNETTKAIEKGIAKLVVIAEDVQPQEIVMHLPIICSEKRCPFISIPSKDDLGRASGINVGTAASCIVEPGEAKGLLAEILEKIKNLEKGKVNG